MLLIVLILSPLAAAALLLLLDLRAPPERARWAALGATLVTFTISCGVAAQFLDLPEIPAKQRQTITPRMELRHTWMTLSNPADGEPVRLEFYLGVDGVSVALILLTTVLCVSSVLVSWTAITERAAEFYAALLILET